MRERGGGGAEEGDTVIGRAAFTLSRDPHGEKYGLICYCLLPCVPLHF